MPRPPRPLLLGTLLALLAAPIVSWLVTRDPDAGAPVVLAPAPETPPRPAAPASSGDVTGGANATSVERTAAPASVAPAPASAPPNGTRIHGTIVATDARGAEHTACNGTLRIVCLVPAAGNANVFDDPEQQIAVTAGRWEAVAPPNAVELHVGSAELDGKPARCTDEVKLASVAPPIALRARWVAPLHVRVLADDTGADLGDVRVVRMDDWKRDDCVHPGNTNIHEVLAHAKSPVQLEPKIDRDEERFWMCSPGYAWNQIRLVTTAPGERVLRLLPGGDVDVTIVGAVPEGAALRVRRDGSSDAVFAELTPARAGTTRVDALPAGKWALFLEQGPWYSGAVLLGATDVVVATGTVATATIEVRTGADVQRPPAIEVRGTLRLPAKWFDVATDAAMPREGIGAIELQPSRKVRAWTGDATHVALAAMTKDGDGSYRWSTHLLAGTWDLLVKGTEYRAVVQVGPNSPTLLDVVVPEPCEVRVHVLDATSGEPLKDVDVGWFALVDDWDNGWSNAKAKHTGDGWYRLHAPPGRIEIDTHPDGYTWSMSDHVVRAGTNEIEVRIARACGVEITLKDGDAVLPFPDDATVQLEHVVTKSGVAYWSGSKVAAKEPGEHVLTMPAPEGFLPVEPRRVVIEPAKWTKVEIVLQRKP